MNRATLLALAFIWVPCLGAEPGEALQEGPTFESQDSPVDLLKRNPDGTLLVSIKPQIYYDELGCVMVVDEQGNAFSQIHYIIAFSLEEMRYWTIWGTSPGGGAPIKLNSNRRYRFLIKILDSRQDDADRPYLILKIWEGDETVYEPEEKPEKTD